MTTAAVTTERLRLGRRLRRAILVVHIAAVGGWIGMDLVLLVLSLRAWLARSPRDRAVSMQALELFGIVPMISLAVLSLVSGVILGLGTKYGLVRYWWVAVKLVINGVFTVLLVVALRPGLNEAAVAGSRLAEGATDITLSSDMAYPLVVSISGLLFAVAVSVFKPWGRVRARRDTGTVGREHPTSQSTERSQVRWTAAAP